MQVKELPDDDGGHVQRLSTLSAKALNQDYHHSTQRCLCKLCGRHIYQGDGAEAWDKEICTDCEPIIS